jgi:hypothetical protein
MEYTNPKFLPEDRKASGFPNFKFLYFETVDVRRIPYAEWFGISLKT